MTVRGILCDLDGVVYRGDQACPGAVEGNESVLHPSTCVLLVGDLIQPGSLVSNSLVSPYRSHQIDDKEIIGVEKEANAKYDQPVNINGIVDGLPCD